MVSKKKVGQSLAALAALLFMQSSHADGLVDSASVEFAAGSKVQMVRMGAQANWSRSWFAANGWHLSGYWDATLAQWRGNLYKGVPGQHAHMTNAGFTPVFRYQRDDGLGLYAEGGIGVNLMSHSWDNDDYRLSTAFEFGDHIGAGYVFDKHWEAGVKIQHFSNGGIKKPNSGVNFLEAKLSYHF